MDVSLPKQYNLRIQAESGALAFNAGGDPGLWHSIVHRKDIDYFALPAIISRHDDDEHEVMSHRTWFRKVLKESRR